MANFITKLNKAFGGGVSLPTSMQFNQSNNDLSSLNSNDVIFSTNDKEEYNQELLRRRQNRYLAKQWKRAQYDKNNNSLNNLSAVQMMYREADMMDLFPEIGAALDIYMEEACSNTLNNQIINVKSKSERIKSILEDLIYNRLSCNTIFPMLTRSTVKYGNTFMLLNITEDNGITGWTQLPVYEMQRFENGMDNPYSHGFTTTNNIDIDKPDSTKFVWVGKNEFTPYRNWQIAHFRLLYDSIFLPFGCSLLNKARRHWRMLSMMEDMMLMYRLDRSIERRVFKVNVGAIDDEDVPAFVDNIANEFKRTSIIDPETGQLDLRRNVMSQMDDFFIPVRDPSEPSPIETLPAGQNMSAMDDIKFVQNKLCTALRVPLSFLNFTEATGDGKNLAMLDVRFSKTINKVQQMMLMELTKVCIIHLYLLGFEDELTNFQLSMNNPSSQSEMLELDNLSKKIEMAKSAVADPGGGIPIMSVSRACKEILGWSAKEISDNLEELRLEKALAAELEQTTSIIKKTGLFNKVDNIYGEPGAEYGDNSGNQQQDDGMGGAGGGGFGGGFGGDMTGDFGGDMTGDMEGEMSGAEGEMSMEDAVASETPNDEPLMEDFSTKLFNKTLKSTKDLLNEHNIKNKKLTNSNNFELFDKNFLINEELNNIAKELNEKLNKK